jgi:hypothetical protein
MRDVYWFCCLKKLYTHDTISMLSLDVFAAKLTSSNTLTKQDHVLFITVFVVLSFFSFLLTMWDVHCFCCLNMLYTLNVLDALLLNVFTAQWTNSNTLTKQDYVLFITVSVVLSFFFSWLLKCWMCIASVVSKSYTHWIHLIHSICYHIKKML